MYVHITPPSPPQSTPFPGMNFSLGKMDPNWAKCLKSGQTFLEVGKFVLFIRGQSEMRGCGGGSLFVSVSVQSIYTILKSRIRWKECSMMSTLLRFTLLAFPKRQLI